MSKYGRVTRGIGISGRVYGKGITGRAGGRGRSIDVKGGIEIGG